MSNPRIFFPKAHPPQAEILYVVILAKYEGQWIFVRHRSRDTWEFPGGHIEQGESPLDAARRELWEETGAVDFDIRPLSLYAVQSDENLQGGYLFFANVSRLSDLPQEHEIAERCLRDTLPPHLTYEFIPDMYDHAQCWLNVQSGAGEQWDIYDEHRRPTGRTHRRGEPLQPGDYHLVVEVFVQDPKTGNFLITRRSPNKGFGNLWECTGGSALSGDSSLAAALREVREETGLILDPKNGQCLFTFIGGDSIKDVWLFRQSIDLARVVLQPGETTDARLASKEDILAMLAEGTFVPITYFPDLLSCLESRFPLE